MNSKKIEVTTPGLMEFLEDNVQGLISTMPWMKDREFRLVATIEELRSFIDEAIKAGKCVIDFETTGLSTRVKKTVNPDGSITRGPTEKIVGVGLCFNPKLGVYAPINHRIDSEFNLSEEAVVEELRRLCTNCLTIYHNAKFDMAQLNLRGVYIDGYKMIEDTMVLARLYDAGTKELKLKVLSERLLNQPMLKFKDMVQNTDRFDLVSPKIGFSYGASDAICTLDLYNLFINSDIIRSQSTIHDLERRVIFAVLEMESNLIKIDVPYLKDQKIKTEARIKAIEQEIYALAGHEFNMSSSQQLGKVLFEEKGFKCEGMTESGKYATDEATLKKLAITQPICKRIIAYRGLEKSLNTYINNLLANHDEDDCIKLGFNQSGTDTGRFSSPGGQGLHEDGYCGLNVQSLPKSTESESGEQLPDMRMAFIARPGKTLIAADYENEEMRVATNLSNETTWIDAVRNNVDFHTATGGIIAGKKNPADVLPAERKLGKTTNFLALYLGGARTLAANAGISEAEAKRVLNAFFAGVPRLKKWIDTEIKKARKVKYVRTLLGRMRSLAKNYDSGDRGMENHADRCAINTQIQGLCADIMKAVMAKCYSWIHRNNLQDDIKMLITMHDELVFEITTEKLELLVPELVKIMMLPEIINGYFHWPIPLTVDVKYGSSWRMKKKFFESFPETKKRLSERLMEFNTIPVEESAPVAVTESEIAIPHKDPFFDLKMTDEQYELAKRVGNLRYTESKRQGCQQVAGCAGYNLETDILGAAGELAYCLYTDQLWSESVNTFKAPDVGTNVQIRTTDRLDGRLIVREKDKGDDLFVLVIADGKKFKIVGSMVGKDAKKPEYLRAPNGRAPAWFVDQNLLTKIEDRRIKTETSKEAPAVESRKPVNKVPEPAPQEPAPQEIKVQEAPKSAELPGIEPEPPVTVSKDPESDEMIYTIRDTGDITLMHLNTILNFMLSEIELNSGRYKGEKKLIKVKDMAGNSLIVSNFKFPADAFTALCRFFKV